MGKVDTYVDAIKRIAIDNSHGYSMASRWGSPDYDCSSLIISVVDGAGIPVKANGATYTGNMLKAFLMAGFTDVSDKVNLATGDGLLPGDILLNEVHHTEMVIQSKLVVGAHWDFDGKPGDSSGLEINWKPYYNYPWDYVLRFIENTTVNANDKLYSITDIKTALEVANGEYGNGNDRIKALQKNGFDSDLIQGLVNEIFDTLIHMGL